MLALLFALAVILPNARFTEDAFISLRTAQNFVLGHGLEWNIGERVQVFTHALWMVPLIAAEWLFRDNAPYAVIGFSILCSLLAVWLFMRDIKSRWAIAFAVLMLLSSHAFINFAAAGLENPLVYVLVILFAHEYLNKRRSLLLSLLLGLTAITRADAAALLLPAFIPLVQDCWHQRRFWFDLAKGSVPLLLWEGFSLVYFGYLLPNTVYAKMLTYLPAGVSDAQATNYFGNSLAWDKISLPVIMIVLAIANVMLILRLTGSQRRYRYHLFLTAGVVLYLLLVIKAGGDYMSGRFFAVPFFLALYLLTLWLQEKTVFNNPKHRFIKPAIVGVLVICAVITPRSPIVHPLVSQLNHGIEIDHGRGDVADEGIFYCPTNCLYNLGNLTMSDFYKAGVNIRGQQFTLLPGIGMAGYAAGPKAHIVDVLGLADPLLSHLSAAPGSRIGHFEREVPNGYLDSLRQGQNVIVDSCVHALYDDIHPVVTGPLFTEARLKNIIKLNLGISDRKYTYCVRHGGRP